MVENPCIYCILGFTGLQIVIELGDFMDLNKASIIKKYTKSDDIEYANAARTKKIGKVRCAGCGEWIRSDGDLENVEISITNRGSAVIFHRDCMMDIWKKGIL